MATMKEWDALIQYHSKENWIDAYNNKRNGKHEDMNTYDDVDNWTTQHINNCVGLHNVHIHSSTERAHVVSHLALHISLHSHWLKFEFCPHFTSSTWSPIWLFSLHVDPLHFILPSLPPVCLSDEQQPELNNKFMENLHNSAHNGTTSSTSPQILSFAEYGEDLHLHFDSAKRVAETAVESAIARFQRTGSARRWDGSFFTTWSTPFIGNLTKVDRKRAERIHPELQKNLCQTFQTDAAFDLACDRDRVLREKRYFLLIWKKFTNRDIWYKRKTKTTKPRQHDLCQNKKSGNYYDNIVTWDIRSQRSWLVHCDTQEQDGKPDGLFLKSYVVQRAKHDLFRCHTVQECCHAVYVLTSPLALTWLTWKSEMESVLKHKNVVCWSTGLQIVQPLWTSYTAKTVMKRVQNCLGETLPSRQKLVLTRCRPIVLEFIENCNACNFTRRRFFGINLKL